MYMCDEYDSNFKDFLLILLRADVVCELLERSFPAVKHKANIGIKRNKNSKCIFGWSRHAGCCTKKCNFWSKISIK